MSEAQRNKERLQVVLDWAYGLLKVALVAIGGAVLTGYEHGEIKTWQMLGLLINTAALAAVPTVITWLMVPAPKSQALEREHMRLREAYADLEQQYRNISGSAAPVVPQVPLSEK